MCLNVNVTLLFPLWLTSLMIGRLGLWPIRRIVGQDSTQPAESVASSASPARASSNHADWHRLSASPALTVSSKNKQNCMITYQSNTIYTEIFEDQCLLSLSSLLCLMCRLCEQLSISLDRTSTKSLPLRQSPCKFFPPNTNHSQCAWMMVQTAVSFLLRLLEA